MIKLPKSWGVNLPVVALLIAVIGIYVAIDTVFSMSHRQWMSPGSVFALTTIVIGVVQSWLGGYFTSDLRDGSITVDNAYSHFEKMLLTSYFIAGVITLLAIAFYRPSYDS